MGTFATDIAELKSLGGVLHGLADEAGRLSVGPSAGAPPATGGTFAPMATGPLLGNSSFAPANTVLTSFLEASAISHELVEGLLVPSLRTFPKPTANRPVSSILIFCKQFHAA